MITISLCMIVRNEEQNLPRCLDSAAGIADEIIIADTGSIDGTKAQALRYTDKVYDFEWTDDFSAARNFAFSKAGMEYCMWLDADDVIEEPDRKLLLQLKNTLPPETDVVMMKYHTAFDDAGNPVFTYYRERLIRRAAGLLWQGAIHETIAPAGNIVYSEAAITHRKTGLGDPDRNIRIFEKLISDGKKLSPREMFYYARELTYHGRDAEAAEIFEEFIASGLGWTENTIEACLNLSGCYSRLGNEEKAFEALVKSFRFDRPRAEICCELGEFFFERGKLSTAVFWYEQALRCERDDRSGGFVTPDCYGYIPNMQLCVCHYRLGNIGMAIEYNEKAGRLKPNSQAYLFNKEFFSQKHPDQL